MSAETINNHMEHDTQAVETTVEETTAQQAATEEPNTETSMSGEDASKQTIEESDIDFYKKKVEELEAQKERAEKKIIKMKREHRPEEEEIQPDLTKETVRQVVLELEAQKQEQKREEYINSVARDENHRKLIDHYLKRVNPSGDYKEDVDLALTIVNSERAKKDAKALKDAQVSEQTASGASYAGSKRYSNKRDTRSAAQKEFERKFRLANNLSVK